MDNYEIEKKYIIKTPSQQVLSLAKQVYEISQTYLSSQKGVSERVRKRKKVDGECEYFYTIKVRINAMKCIEDEKQISFDEYEKLLERKDMSLNQIQKTRYVIEFDGLDFEIDIYSFWKNIASMEVELESENQKFKLPENTEILKDVTTDARLKNHSLAKNIVPEEEFFNLYE